MGLVTGCTAIGPARKTLKRLAEAKLLAALRVMPCTVASNDLAGHGASPDSTLPGSMWHRPAATCRQGWPIERRAGGLAGGALTGAASVHQDNGADHRGPYGRPWPPTLAAERIGVSFRNLT